jgi:putative aldouronate transport system permease protein
LNTRRSVALWKEIKANHVIYLMLIPGLVFLFIVKYVPMYGLQIAFKEFNPFLGVWKSPYVGLDYFIRAFESDIFWRSFKNTVVIAFVKFIVGMPMPILLAIMLNQLRIHFLKKIVQTVSYFPHLISWVVVGGLSYSFLGTFGFINKFLAVLGMEKMLFYQNADVWLPILVITEVWKSVGWGSILYLAALSAVNTDLYEAIEIDGGGRFRKIQYVDLPVLMPVFAIMLILNSSSLVSGNFDQVFALIGDSIVSPNSLLAAKTETLEVYTYRVGILEGSFSFSGAIGFFQNVLAAILIFTTNYIAGKVYDDKRLTLF